MTNANQTVHLFAEALPVAISDQGSGRTFLILHGGAGPASVSGLAGALSRSGRAIVPTHPGFAGQPQPEWFRRVDDLVLAYLALLEQVDARDVVLVGIVRRLDRGRNGAAPFAARGRTGAALCGRDR